MTLEIPCPECKATLRVREEYLGKQLKCPRCAAVISVPAEAAAAEPLEQVRPVVRPAPPPVPADQPAAADVAEKITVEDPRQAIPVVAVATQRCPRCGETIPARADRCRYCRAWLDEEDEEDDDLPPPIRAASYKPCPRCGATGADRVTWTPWGSFYGPAMFTHVRCRECGYGYNGKTGRSNLVPAIFMVVIPAILIVAIVAWLLYVLGVFGGRRW
jgi:hypothetical protein